MKYVLEKKVPAERRALSVSEITRNIRALLEEGLSSVWVEGEISNFKRHSSGHMYFSLKDDQAQLGCVMFRRENSALVFEPADGMKVVCFGRVGVWAPRGQYQLYVERLEPKGVGALQIRFEQMREKLRREGLFDEARKRPLPFLARRIAVVTSRDGAALRDILSILERRFSNAHILIAPVPVQGAGAASEIAWMIDALNEARLADVLIVGRGGGSLEDLWAFNEETVARAIFRSGIPVISAVGHETDFTIADFVADLRAPTPSAAAELVLPRREDLLERIVKLKLRAAQAFLADIPNRFQRLGEMKRALGMFLRSYVLSRKETAARLVGKLDVLGPLATLKRGFSVSLKLPGRKVLSTVRAVKIGDQVETRLRDGFFKSRVTEVKNGKRSGIRSGA